jgi:kynurenine formamidase
MKDLIAFASAIASGEIRVIDLTQTLTEDTPLLQLPKEFGESWPFRIKEISRYDERGPFWYWNNISCGEHTGTHFDAPIHWVTGKDHQNNATDTIPPQKFIAPACVIDCAAQAGADNDYLLTVGDIEAWEAKHGRIPEGAWVLLRTDWSKRRDPAEYLNMDEEGAHTPGPSAEAVRFLAEQRNVIGFGGETVGTDSGKGFTLEPPLPCHNIMHGTNRFGLASLTNLDQLPPTGAVVIAAPLKIKNGSGSPCRVLALVPA